MRKRQLTLEEAFDLRQILHVSALDALLATRRWTPGELVFHGGTSLHLVYGSPRHSEDLDFMTAAKVDPAKIASGIQDRLQGSTWMPEGTDLVVERVRDAGRMASFNLSVKGSSLMGSLKVKVEMWRAGSLALDGLKTVVAPARLPPGRYGGLQAFVPTAQRREIMADKVFALGSRPYLKPRDIFDIHWLTRTRDDPKHAQQGDETITTQDLKRRFDIYETGGLGAWQDALKARRDELRRSDARETILSDLRRWLPAAWPLSADTVSTMIDDTTAAIDHGLDLLHPPRPRRSKPCR